MVDEDATAQSQSRNARRERDVIEDSDDGEFSAGGDKSNELVDDAIDSSPPQHPQSPGLLDAEFDTVFAPVRDRSKRRRIFVQGDALSRQRQEPQHDLVISSSPELQPKADAFNSPDFRPSRGPAGPEPAVQKSPAAILRPAAGASTPGNTKTPFRNRPRFMLSSTQKHSNSRSVSKSDTPPTKPPTSPAERRKPVFVLPRSPSPSAAEGDIPAPFSPSSRTLHRRGRPRSGVPGYLPGGMAAEVRSWILEIGAKRDQACGQLTPVSTESTRGVSSDELGNYLVAARVIQASQIALSSSGPLAFIKATQIVGSAVQDKNPDSAMSILVMGLPRSKPPSRQMSSATTIQAPDIQTGDLIGVHHGLSWKLELNTDLTETEMSSSMVIQLPQHSSDNEVHANTEEWLVAMEWDLIQDT